MSARRSSRGSAMTGLPKRRSGARIEGRACNHSSDAAFLRRFVRSPPDSDPRDRSRESWETARLIGATSRLYYVASANDMGRQRRRWRAVSTSRITDSLREELAQRPLDHELFRSALGTNPIGDPF